MGEGSWRVGSSHLREALGERQHVLEKVLAAQLARHLPHLPRHARHAKGVAGGRWRLGVPFAATRQPCRGRASPRR